MECDYLPFSPMPKSAEACRKRVSALIRAMPRNQPISDPLLSWLAQWSRKLHERGVHDRVRYFTVEDNWGNGYALIAHAEDGQAVNFRYADPVADYYRVEKTGAIESASARQQRRLRKTMRNEIGPDLMTWKREHPAPGAGCVIDHAWPDTFDALVARFRRLLTAQERHGDAMHDMVDDADFTDFAEAEIEIADGTPKTKHMDTILDRAVARQWLAFHREHARVRWLTKKINGELGKGDPALRGHTDLPPGVPIT